MSQHSTTLMTTEVHNLVKYSRSYGLGADTNEWQHFVNPVIKVLLDAKKSPKGELTSVRLRILWLMNTGNDAVDVDRREEDLELLSFSSLLSNHTQPIRNAQGLPLKAVHRDSVVGIRYLHPITVQANSSPVCLLFSDNVMVYRRFQITFETSSAASQFIDTIRHVCPCKHHEPLALGRTTTTAPFSMQVQNQNTQQPTPHSPARIGPLVHTSDYPASTHLSAIPISSRPSAAQSSPMGAASSSNLGLSCFQSPNISTTPNMSSSRSSSLSDPHNRECNPASSFPTPAGAGANSSVNGEPQKIPSIEHQNLSLPNSSQPSFNSDSSSMPPPPLPFRAHRSVATISTSTSVALPPGSDHGILGSLREAPALYNLSRAELEDLVSHVVREEGFAELLENLNLMWKVKGFLER